MPLFRSSTPSAPVQPRSWLRRHKVIATLVVVAAVAAGLAVWQPWKPCDTAMTTVEPSSNCVGLNVENTSFGPNDAVGDLRQRVAEHNAGVTEPNSVTVVVLDNMTPDPRLASIGRSSVRHGVEGALTAARRANAELVVGGTSPRVKLLLANYGTSVEEAEEAARQIQAAREREHIVAVVGLGQSLQHTRTAASRLSDAGIAVVSGMASADNMNKHVDDDKKDLDKFFRITPTNIDAARAGAAYLRERGADKVMLVEDTNETDIYARTLARAFKDAYRDREFSTVRFTSLSGSEGSPRADFMAGEFARVYTRICLEKPRYLYFAGRGIDLDPLLKTMSQNGSCSGVGDMDVVTSDDATNIVNRPLPEFDNRQVRVFYTSVATMGQWANEPGQEENQASYGSFESQFVETGLDGHDGLLDGYAMSVHDAFLVATKGAREVPDVNRLYTKVADKIKAIDCVEPFGGATGKIAYQNEQAGQGNPVGKAMPIMRLEANGRPVQESLVWPSGQPFGPQSCR
ncbi:hypothetical protein [Saccharopolyspora sp. NPDC049426]|uniref:hypothetical protein n=1 Tax=Saccharopolyspora sp. NPDC049426 TaxID=3155652 RepID=UPI0034414B5D